MRLARLNVVIMLFAIPANLLHLVFNIAVNEQTNTVENSPFLRIQSSNCCLEGQGWAKNILISKRESGKFMRPEMGKDAVRRAQKGGRDGS